MPKVKYNSGKGLYQEKGSGIFLPTASLTGKVFLSPATVFETTTITDQNIIFADASSGHLTCSLPDASANYGRLIWFKKIDSSGFNVVLDGYESQRIDSNDSIHITEQNVSLTLLASGSNWYII